MKTHLARTAWALVFVASSTLNAQKAPSAADQEFREVQLAAIPINPVPTPPGTKKTRESFETDRQMQAAGFLTAAEKANAFYSKNPSHEKAEEAKKIEVISMLRAALTGAVEQETKALRLAREYRADSKKPSRDRFQVASTVNQIEIRKKGISKQADLMAEYQQRSLDLLAEFPDEPALMDMMLGIAKNSEPGKARSVAQQILRLPAPKNIKEEAQNVIDRLEMPGKPIALEWQDEEGKFYNITAYKGKVVVFYLWATWTTASEAANAKIPSLLKPGVELISVNVDTEIKKAKESKAKASFTGIGYYDDRGLKGPLPKQLKATKVPSVHVVDRNGNYVGTGAVNDLPALLQKAGL